MHIFELASSVWWRAQSVYTLLHVVGIILGILASPFSEEAGNAAGFLFFTSLFSCASALVFGVPVWIVYAFVMTALAPLARRLHVLFPTVLVTSLAAAWLALYLAFDVVFGGEFSHGAYEFEAAFSAMAYFSMFISVLTLRRSIVRRSTELAHPDATEIPESINA